MDTARNFIELLDNLELFISKINIFLVCRYKGNTINKQQMERNGKSERTASFMLPLKMTIVLKASALFSQLAYVFNASNSTPHNFSLSLLPTLGQLGNLLLMTIQTLLHVLFYTYL